ncbi:hypothetical protein [Nitrosomonas supralitoralis]|uniref:hypothetical protein n=1 Tax=Nitrosomonas supralitoralis TaxID=2116706 RepID=UPI001F5B47B6|nr:hypothetical protein [Nitrosomonas supralitoralis]
MICYISQKRLPLEGLDTPPGMILDSNNHWLKQWNLAPKISASLTGKGLAHVDKLHWDVHQDYT